MSQKFIKNYNEDTTNTNHYKETTLIAYLTYKVKKPN
jgi:hypothetical protein